MSEGQPTEETLAVAPASWRQRLQTDLRSKLMDGLGAAFILYLGMLTMAMMVRPVQNLSGSAGVLVYIVVLLAISIFCLERSLVTRWGERTRAWWGMAGGLLAWSVTMVSNNLGAVELISLPGITMLMMVGLIVSVLWRRVLPLGVRFYAFSYMLFWAGTIFLGIQGYFGQVSHLLKGLYWVNGILAAAGGLYMVYFILIKTTRRIPRLWGGLWLCFFLITLQIVVRRGIL